VTVERGPFWRQVPPLLRALAFWATIAQVVGYTTGLIFIHHTTGMTPPGVEQQYRGIDSTAVSDAAMKFPKSYSEMLTITGLALALCQRPALRWRTILVIEPFVALLVSFSSMWLMRYVDARFSWLLTLSSGVMALTFYVQSFFVLRELNSLSGAP
jgi:hypothetical protein